jgi:hypothetical protein
MVECGVGFTVVAPARQRAPDDVGGKHRNGDQQRPHPGQRLPVVIGRQRELEDGGGQAPIGCVRLKERLGLPSEVKSSGAVSPEMRAKPSSAPVTDRAARRAR